MMADKRISQRYPARLVVLASTVVDRRHAIIVDISRHGAKIEIGEPYAAGDDITLELAGERLASSVTWAESDRIGVRFAAPIETGVFADALNAAARESSFKREPADARRGSVSGFGRRAP